VDIARRRPFRWSLRGGAIAGAIGVIAIVAIATFFVRSTKAAARSVEKTSVWIERVRRGDLLRQVPVQGTLVPERVQWLSSASAARVSRIAVRPGAQVEADAIVVVLENAELELAALEAERQAASAEAALIQLDVRTAGEEQVQNSAVLGLRAELRTAQNHAIAAERLAPEGLMSTLDHHDALSKAEDLGVRVEAEEARRHGIVRGRTRQLAAQHAEIARLKEIAAFRRRQLAALEIHAGVRGVVQDIPLENGQWVAIGTTLAKIAEPDHLKAEVKVAEAYAKDIYRGLSVRFESPGATHRGHIDRIDPAVVAGNVRLTVTLDDGLPPGARVDQTVSGYVEIEKLDNVLFVARPAGAQDGATTRLFRIDADRVHASRVTARLGRGSAREIEITSGLVEGDEVIVSDVSTWETTDRIRLK
jgi:multidrug efflux pump subunit AcrA (membrane-fusion protein)